MGKLIRYTHDIQSNKLACLVRYTVQDKVSHITVTLDVADLLAESPNWGVALVCSELTALTGFVVTL